jgi:hypothetical protein
MPDGDPIKEAIRTMIQQELANLMSASTAGQSGNTQGTISAVNADGTVNVETQVGSLQSVGTPVVRTIGEQVVVVTSQEGAMVAI